MDVGLSILTWRGVEGGGGWFDAAIAAEPAVVVVVVDDDAAPATAGIGTAAGDGDGKAAAAGGLELVEVGVGGGRRCFLGLRRDFGVCQPCSGGGVLPLPGGGVTLKRNATCLVGLSRGQLGRGGGGGAKTSKPVGAEGVIEREGHKD